LGDYKGRFNNCLHIVKSAHIEADRMKFARSGSVQFACYIVPLESVYSRVARVLEYLQWIGQSANRTCKKAPHGDIFMQLCKLSCILRTEVVAANSGFARLGRVQTLPAEL
jgi:hypothetical protein